MLAKLEYACSEGSDPESIRVWIRQDSQYSFSKTIGSLHVNQTKCFMMMIASFMDLHSIH